jgi:hypothetical protein
MKSWTMFLTGSKTVEAKQSVSASPRVEWHVLPSTTDQSPSQIPFIRLNIHLPVDQLERFFPLFQRGITLPATIGCSLKNLLCGQLAIPEEYVTERITTVFCDNCPVDDFDKTIIQEGSRIALSAAMPGLVGATMRRGGFYSALRQGISHLMQAAPAVPEDGTVTLKLFNLLMTELGPSVMAHGILLDSQDLQELRQVIPALSDTSTDGTGQTLLVVTFVE